MLQIGGKKQKTGGRKSIQRPAASSVQHLAASSKQQPDKRSTSPASPSPSLAQPTQPVLDGEGLQPVAYSLYLACNLGPQQPVACQTEANPNLQPPSWARGPQRGRPCHPSPPDSLAAQGRRWSVWPTFFPSPAGIETPALPRCLGPWELTPRAPPQEVPTTLLPPARLPPTQPTSTPTSSSSSSSSSAHLTSPQGWLTKARGTRHAARGTGAALTLSLSLSISLTAACGVGATPAGAAAGAAGEQDEDED
ncbi:hypothetical protein J7T55_010738 [Diaporthe amygdali]|uniref:uncharacterized protein n=1 Tax=Phomopsis amygdali TaxID=1214568 RepID=UPI0022FF34F3|nr:uncharacterized protein J7T55_010738 [Diaporthe amygdali]KAJ0114349.1 hypothetical protein J7T55_010738 [Diaporthe amygdali]